MWPTSTTPPKGSPGIAPLRHQPTTFGSGGMARRPSAWVSTGTTRADGPVTDAPIDTRLGTMDTRWLGAAPASGAVGAVARTVPKTPGGPANGTETVNRPVTGDPRSCEDGPPVGEAAGAEVRTADTGCSCPGAPPDADRPPSEEATTAAAASTPTATGTRRHQGRAIAGSTAARVTQVSRWSTPRAGGADARRR